VILTGSVPAVVLYAEWPVDETRSIWKMLGPFATASRFFAFPPVRCRYCRTPPAHRCPRQRRQRQRVTEGTAMAPWNGPNYRGLLDILHSKRSSARYSPTSAPQNLEAGSRATFVFPYFEPFHHDDSPNEGTLTVLQHFPSLPKLGNTARRIHWPDIKLAPCPQLCPQLFVT